MRQFFDKDIEWNESVNGKDNLRMTNRHFQTCRWEKHIIAYNIIVTLTRQQKNEEKKKTAHRNCQWIFFFGKREKKTVANETAPA